MSERMGIATEQALLLGGHLLFIAVAHFKGKQCQLRRMSPLFLLSAQVLSQGDPKDQEH